MTVCTVCGTPNPNADFVCGNCLGTTFRPADQPDPAPASAAADGPAHEPAGEPEAEPDVAGCWNCGTRPPNPGNDRCLNPDCRRSLTPPALVLKFPTGQVELQRGQTALLGRAGSNAAVFAGYDNVSRQHATLGVDDEGRPWIEPVSTAPNGTFVNGAEAPAGMRTPLSEGVVVGFAARLKGTVKIYLRGER